MASEEGNDKNTALKHTLRVEAFFVYGLKLARDEFPIAVYFIMFNRTWSIFV